MLLAVNVILSIVIVWHIIESIVMMVECQKSSFWTLIMHQAMSIMLDLFLFVLIWMI